MSSITIEPFGKGAWRIIIHYPDDEIDVCTKVFFLSSELCQLRDILNEMAGKEFMGERQ